MKQEELISKIEALKTTKDRLIIIAISGYCGSGKSMLAHYLKWRLKEAEVVSIDDFIIGPPDQRSSEWDTFDRDRLKNDILKVVRPNKPIRYLQYQSGIYASHRPGKTRTIVPQKYLIIEGCSVIQPSLMHYYDFSIWIDCPFDLAIERAKERDRMQGMDNDKLWDEVWEPNDIDFFSKYSPDKLATVKYKFPTINHFIKLMIRLLTATND
jgi:uridine kinase